MSLRLERNAVLFLSISLVGGFGSTAMSAVAGIWVMHLTDSASLAALVGMCMYLPTLAGPLLGAVADRLPRRQTLIWTSVARAAVIAALLAVRDESQTWLIFAVMLVYGTSYIFVHAAESAMLPAVLAPETLGQLNGARMTVREGMKLIAPLLGAGMFAWKGGHPVVLADAAALALVAVLYARLPYVATAAPAEAAKGFVRQGIQWLWSHPVLRPAVLAASVCVALSGLATAASFALVVEGLGKDPAFMGVMAAAQGAGSIVGGVATGWALGRLGEVRLAGVGAFLFALGILIKWVPAVSIAVTGTFLVGLGLPATVIASMTAVQRLTPAHLLGRVSGTETTLIFAPVAGAIPLGAALILGLSYQAVLLLTALAGFAVAGYMLVASKRVVITA